MRGYGLSVERNPSPESLRDSTSPYGRGEEKPVPRPMIPFYSSTACSGAADCLRSAALLEPIMIASGSAHSVMIMTI